MITYSKERATRLSWEKHGKRRSVEGRWEPGGGKECRKPDEDVVLSNRQYPFSGMGEYTLTLPEEER